MVRDKDIRPTRARLLGNVLPDMATLLTQTSYEDFHTTRSKGTNVTYKGSSVTTLNLNSVWVETQLSITEVTCTTLNEAGKIVVHLYNKETNAPLANEEVIITVGDYTFIRFTNTQGFAGVYNFTLTETGEYTVTAEYYGNSRRNYMPSEPDEETFTIGKLNVTITQANLTGSVGDTFTIIPTVRDSNGDLVTSGRLQMNYGSYTLFTEDVVNGTCTFHRQINQSVQYTYWLKFLGTSTHNPATCNFTITVNRINPTLTLSGTSSTVTTKLGEPVEIAVNYKDNQGNPITTGTVHLYDGNTIVETAQRVENGKIIFTYPSSATGTHNLTVKANETDKYAEVTRAVTVVVNKLETTTSIALQDLYDFPSSNYNFTITVTDENDDPVTSGTVDLVFVQDRLSEESTVATYDLTGTNGTITVSRQNVLLDELYDKMVARKYLYYTGYNVTANYNGSTNYETSTDTKYPMNIHMYSSIIRPVIVINNDPDYDMSTTYPTVPHDNTSLAEFHIRPNTRTGSHQYIKLNRTYSLVQDTTRIQMGSVTRGQVIHIATDYIASHVTDVQRATTNTQSIEMYSVGGLNTEIHYQINNGTEIDTATAQVNGGTTRYTVPRYVKFTVPNTVTSGDTLTLIFYVGRNVGYYDVYDNTYGFKYMLTWEVD